jgi:O-antigen ligase/polysaccharide polymerase Wzy-like membrane protein
VRLRLNASSAVVLASAGLLVAALFFGGGTDTDRLLPIGLAALFVAGALVVATLAGLLPVPRLDTAGIAFLALLAGFVLWSGLSVDWSIAPDLSWDLFNRELAYLAFALAGLYAGALVPRSVRVVASGLALALGAVIAWALAGKVIPSLFPDGGRFARLRSPVGYWNGLALLAAVALVLGLWIATDSGRRRAHRIAGAVLTYGALVAVVLTYSRSGIAVAVLGTLAWLLLGGEAFETLAALLVAGIGAVPVLAFALLRSGITGDHQLYSTRVQDGALFAPVLLGGVALVVAGAYLLLRAPPVSERLRRVAVRGTIGAGALAVAAVLVVLFVRAGGPGPWIEARWHEFSSSSAVPQQSSRLGSLSSNHRWTWWQEAWRSFEHAPAEGRGAGSFPIVNLLERPSAITVTQPHNLLLQALSDTGVIGFVLLAGAIAAAVLAVRRTIGRASGDERSATVALAIGAGAYLVQALVDIDWDFVATTGPLFFVLGALVARGTRPSSLSLWALGGAAAAGVAAASLLVPWLSVRKTDDAYGAIAGGDAVAAVSDAKQANSLNPLSVEPLYWLALARIAQSRIDDAELAYARAVKLQPDNPNTWFELGAFELETNKDKVSACAVLTRAVELDRFDSEARRLRDRACP